MLPLLVSIQTGPAAFAQESADGTPRSAISWLSRSVATQRPAPDAASATPAATENAPPMAGGNGVQGTTPPPGQIPFRVEGADEATGDIAVSPAAAAGAGDQPPLQGIESEEIVATPLGRISKDAVGLFPPEVSGLPESLWHGSSASVLAELIRAQPIDGLPAMRALLYTILLAEVAPPDAALPAASGADGTMPEAGAATAGRAAPQIAEAGQQLLLARLDKLLEMGALDPAQALIERAGPDDPEIFRRWFDVSLLTDHADRACAALRATPDLAPTMPARIFCLARNGDWNAAVVTLETGTTLGFLNEEESDLIARFLDPEAFDDPGDIAPPEQITPLIFAMREAIGAPRPPGVLPLAFAHADLTGRAGKRNQILAAERLARTGAIDPALLIAIYTEGRPAASGGVWDRVAAVQAFDIALLSGNDVALAAALGPAMKAMHAVGLEVPFARYYGDRILTRAAAGGLPPEARAEAMKLVLLSDAYERAPMVFGGAGASGNAAAPAGGDAGSDPHARFLLQVAAGLVAAPPPEAGTLEHAIAQAFSQPLDAPEFEAMLRDGRLGEAILRAMLLVGDGGQSDPVQVRRALSVLRRVGLEEEARKAALQLLLLDLRG